MQFPSIQEGSVEIFFIKACLTTQIKMTHQGVLKTLAITRSQLLFKSIAVQSVTKINLFF